MRKSIFVALLSVVLLAQEVIAVEGADFVDVNAKPALRTGRKPTKAELKAAKAAKKALDQYLKVPFDLSTNKVPVPFLGHNIEFIYKAFEQQKLSAKKGEFETTAQYQKRLVDEKSAPLFNKVRPDSVLAFTFVPESAYDADSQIFTISTALVSVNSESYTGHEARLAIKVKDNVQSKTVTGQNAYGARVEMTELSSGEYAIAIHNFNSFATNSVHQFPTQKLIEERVKLSPSEAKHLKDNLKAVCIVSSLSQPQRISYGASKNTATYYSPTELIEQRYYVEVDLLELWLYDNTTGKILRKIKQKPVEVSTPEEATLDTRQSK